MPGLAFRFFAYKSSLEFCVSVVKPTEVLVRSVENPQNWPFFQGVGVTSKAVVLSSSPFLGILILSLFFVRFEIFGPARSRPSLMRPRLQTSPDLDLILSRFDQMLGRVEAYRIRRSLKSDRAQFKIRWWSPPMLKGRFLGWRTPGWMQNSWR